MIATVSASSEQYNHTINTLKYANRAKEIKTNVAQNVVIARERHHIGDYQHVIDDLQSKVASLTTQLANKEEKASRASHPSAASGHSFSEAWLDALSDDINENVEERINIQKALFELEDINNQNVYERSALKRRLLQVTDSNPNNSTERRSLRGRIDDIDETIRANEALGAKYRKDVDANELVRVAIQSRIDAAIAEEK
jgi:kinesin family protein 18/19